MQMITTYRKHLGALVVAFCLVAGANAQTQNVTLTLNMASSGDTTRTDAFVEVRGALNGVAPDTMADGNIIDWGEASTLEPVNIGGDYWQVSFELDAADTALTFKFYNQELEDKFNAGWEANPGPTDNHELALSGADTTLPVHFFSPQIDYRSGLDDRSTYAWRPYEPMEGYVAVWYRVYMNTPEGAVTDGYDPDLNAPDQQIGVRGDDFTQGGPLDWGITEVTLTRESTSSGTPGYDLYSGVAWYPDSLVGRVQNYKFVLDNDILDDDNLGWEDGNLTGNRTFTIPAQDTTLQWVYYGDTPPSAVDPVTADVIFSVDLDPLQQIGVFDRARGDTLEVRGGFNGWGCSNPDLCLLDRIPGTDQFDAQVTMTAIPGTSQDYKFFINFNDENFVTEFGVDPPSGWEEPITTQGANRSFEFSGSEQDLGVQRFNDVLAENIVPEGTSIDLVFEVDMTDALSAAEPFNPTSDTVFIKVEEPIWAFTQGIEPNDNEFARLLDYPMVNTTGNIYTVTVPVTGPTYAALQYKYSYGSPTAATFQTEEGGSTSGPGRRRTRFVTPNPDGSWPTNWVFPQESYQETGELPFENNPVGTAVEAVGDEVPSTITLKQNYPNPFNPTTTFEYTINDIQNVKLAVYDIVGRQVALLVDGVQPASTYRVSFDATDLASGTYFYRLEAAGTVLTKTMVLVK